MRRLRTRAQFQALLRTPPVARTAHFALHRLKATSPEVAEGGVVSASVFLPAGPAWLGAMTPKRCARRAVTRNAIRRQIYALGEQLDPHDRSGLPDPAAGGVFASPVSERPL